jgi:hypothetical protein
VDSVILQAFKFYSAHIIAIATGLRAIRQFAQDIGQCRVQPVPPDQPGFVEPTTSLALIAGDYNHIAWVFAERIQTG